MSTNIFNKIVASNVMAESPSGTASNVQAELDALNAVQVKEFSSTTTTSSVGTFVIPDADLPNDFHCVVGIKGTTYGNCYVVQYDAKTFGVFTYNHYAYANESYGITFMYV